jgi:amino acid permease
MSNKAIAIVAGIVGVILLGVGFMYMTQTADHLPSFFPGHSATATPDKHMKHAIAAIVVAVFLFVFAWFASGKKSTSAAGK